MRWPMRDVAVVRPANSPSNRGARWRKTPSSVVMVSDATMWARSASRVML